jgi:hypothetical protein
MSETVTENAEVAGYLAAIRDALSDLESADRDDLLEDLEAHLHEVLAEPGGTSLASSLGTPAQYAAELRAAAGLDPQPIDGLPLLLRLERQLSSSGVLTVTRSIMARPAAREALAYLRTLRPAWWLVRGWLLAFAITVLLDGHYSRQRQQILWIPTDGRTGLRAFLCTLTLVVVSIWIGLRTSRLAAAPRNLLGLLNAFLVLFALALYSGFSASGSYLNTAAYFPQPQQNGLNVDGRQLVNVFPYDAAGHLLQDVRLYDDRGRPLNQLADQTDRGEHLVRSYPTDSAGRVVTNAFPQAVEVEPFAGPQASASEAALVGAFPASGAVAIASAVAVPPPAIVVPPLAGVTPAPTPTPMVTPVPSAATPIPSVAPTPSSTTSKSKGTKTTAAASKPTTRATTATRGGTGRSSSRTP